jgi:Second Messenger Oligonucleotide or Dinucleotide Synthetase domain
MADIEALLRQRSSQVYPTRAQLDRAARSHNFLREVLQSGNMDSRIIDSYLSGSYSRHTALRPLDDVDIIVEIDPSYWRRSAFARLFDGLLEPEAVLETFAVATRLRYQTYGTSVWKQRRSIRLGLEHVSIDVVPAVIDDERPQWYRIPDVSEGRWIPTAPKVHSEITSSLNERHAKLFVPTVRLLKAWNLDLPSTVRIKSFAIETLAARLFRAVPLTSFTDGLHVFMDFVCWLGGEPSKRPWKDALDVRFGGLTPRLPDLAGTGSNLFANCKRDRLAGLARAASVMRRALEAAGASRSTESAWARIERRLRARLDQL